jgi:outer membrane protein OmpA-like peptidoglycan-associated protein
LLNNAIFKNVPSKYTVREIFESEAGLYSYIIDQQLSLMASWPAYNEMISSGFRDASVRLSVLKDPAEKDLYKILKNYSLLTDINFDASNRLTTTAYIMLDQVVTLMNKYPQIRIEIGVHTDNQGALSNNLSVSQFRAQLIVNYLINRGISGKRLTAKGYGDVRPVASNANAPDRRLNNRVEFMVN